MTAKIRVLHPITRLIIGGAQENTLLTAQLLDKSTWQVEVLCGPQTGLEGSLIEAARAKDIPLLIEPNLVREVNPIRDFMTLLRLMRHIRRNRYTIVHTHSSKAGILGRWAAKLAGVPIIVHTVHGWGHHDHQHPAIRAYYILLEKLTLPLTDKLIVVTTKDIEKGLQDGIGKPDNYRVIRSGIELDRFGHPQVTRAEMRERLGIPLDAPVVGTVTRLSTQKSPLDFVRAAAIVAEQMPTAYFVMVGDGNLRAAVQELATELGIADRLVLTGLRNDVPELMATFDVFALSSLWEGLPRVLPQAMATGLPLVATAIDGSAEAIEDGDNGLLVPPGQPQQLAQALLTVLQDPLLAAQMAAASRQRVVEFDAVTMVEQIESLYKSLLHQKHLL